MHMFPRELNDRNDDQIFYLTPQSKLKETLSMKLFRYDIRYNFNYYSLSLCKINCLRHCLILISKKKNSKKEE